MTLRAKTLLISILIAGLAGGWLIYKFYATPSDLWNTNLILVQVQQTGESREIRDKGVIHKIVGALLKEETPGITEEMTQSYTYSLELFTEHEGYGPLYCSQESGVCWYESDTAGRYIEVPDDFFTWIEQGIQKADE